MRNWIYNWGSSHSGTASQQIRENIVASTFTPVQLSGNKTSPQLSSSYLLASGAYRKMALKVERISLDSVVAKWPPVLTRPTRSPFLKGRIRLKDTEPPQPQLPPSEPLYWPAAGPAELCSLWTLRLDTDRTACTLSPCLAVSSPEIKYRPSRGTVKIPVESRKGKSEWERRSIMFVEQMFTDAPCSSSPPWITKLD